MFRHILIPLDGSRLAEAVLPLAAALAARLGARVTLVHIIETDAPPTVHGERHLTDPAEAEAYLAQAAAAFPPGVAVERHVHRAPVADVARAIVDHHAELAPDLVAMCTHGRGGLRGMVSGSIAQQVVAAGVISVLLLRAGQPPGAAPLGRRALLVPLDTSAAHAQGLDVAAHLAQALDAELRLLTVVPTWSTMKNRQGTSGQLAPGAARVMLEAAQAEAGETLRALCRSLGQQNLRASAEVRRGNPAAQIRRAARASAFDLVVMGTHGKAGTRAFWSGSVAAEVLARCPLPVLLVPECGPAPAAAPDRA